MQHFIGGWFQFGASHEHPFASGACYYVSFDENNVNLILKRMHLSMIS
jgi:hypothetical protein